MYREALQNFIGTSNTHQPDTNVLVSLLEIILKNNTFEFDGKVYQQLLGTAMGTTCALSYANLFMGRLE